MRCDRHLTLGLALALFATTGCADFAERYVCQNDSQCVTSTASGRCLASSCAFPDATCALALRFDESAAPASAGQCAVPVSEDPRFAAIADPSGAATLAPVTLAFPGATGKAYLATFNGSAQLLQLDTARAALTTLQVPTLAAALQLGVAAPPGLFVATAAGLFFSSDGGLSFQARAPLAFQALGHDGNYLYALGGGQLFVAVGDGSVLLPISPPAGTTQVVALIGGGYSVAGGGPVLTLTWLGASTVVYRMDGATWTKVLSVSGTYSSGSLTPGGLVVLSGLSGSPGTLTVQPGGPMLPSLPQANSETPMGALQGLAFLPGGVWSTWSGQSQPLRWNGMASTTTWAVTAVDPLAQSAAGLLAIPAAAGGEVLVLVSNMTIGATTRSRLWLGSGAL